MLQQLRQIFHSITKSLEVLYVIEDVKPCSRILVYEGDLDNVVDSLKNYKINYLISDFKVIKQNIQSEFYSDKSIKTHKNDARKGYFFVYLSKNMEIAKKAKIAEDKNSHKELGLLLGYPDCCCNFFEKNFDKNNTDLTLKILKNSNGYEFPFYANIAARHFDVSLLSHFPHSFECKPSIEIAKNNLKTIKEHSEQLAAMLAGILQSIVVYTLNEGIFLLRNYKKIGNEFIYGDVLSTTKSKLYFLLNFNKQLKIIDKNNFIVGDVSISGKDYGAMVFS